MIEEKLKTEHTDKHLLFHNLWIYMVNHNFNKELEKIVSDEEIQMYEKYNLNDKEGLKKRLKFLDEKIPKLFEIVQKDIAFICYEVGKENIKSDNYNEFNKKYDLKIEKLKIAILIYKGINRYYLQRRLSLGLEIPEVSLNKLLAIERNLINNELLNLERRQNEKLEIFRKENEKTINSHTKDILNTMGIFLSIFSVIGLGVSSILKLESNHVATWLMICGTILITMTGLFTLINKKIEIMKILVIIIGLVLFGAGRIIRCVFPEENKELVKQEDFKLVKDDVNNVKNITNTEDAQINNLKVEIEKLKSKIEELENNKSKNRK